MNDKKFILDSNIWISYIITDTLDVLTRSIVQNELQIYGDRFLINEIREVLSRQKFKRYLKISVSRFIEVIELGVIMIDTQPYISHLPDSKDNFLVALSHASQTTKVVTGDKILLALMVYEGIEFIALADFRKLLRQN